MILEQLPPDQLTDQLKLRREELKQLLHKKIRALKTSPQGRLRVAQAHDGRKIQYYHLIHSGETKGTYLPRSQHPLARRLAQKQYDQQLVRELQAQVRAIDRLIAACENKITALYKNLCPARQALITPVTLTASQYIEAWQNIQWQANTNCEDSLTYTTLRHEQVRSKSEVIIADTLSHHKIPYRYEYPLELKDGRLFHPDFLCLNVRTRQEFFWEHFGMMDSPDYAIQTAAKLKLFSENNIHPGKNLILTMETLDAPLNTRQVESLIKAFLL